MPEDKKVPVFRTWTQWYVFVLLFLAVQILLFHLFTQYFS